MPAAAVCCLPGRCLPLTLPELDVGNCGRRRWEWWSSAKKEERVSWLPSLIAAVQVKSDG